MNTLTKLWFALAAVGLIGAAAPAWSQQDPDSVAPVPAVQTPAAALQLPPPPQSAHLLPVPGTGSAALRFLVDPASVGSDGAALVSYTLVVRSAALGDSANFELIDCDQNAWRVDAVWTAGRWQRQSAGAWQAIGSSASVHGVLARDYLCSNSAAAGTSQQLVESLRRGVRGDRPMP